MLKLNVMHDNRKLVSLEAIRTFWVKYKQNLEFLLGDFLVHYSLSPTSYTETYTQRKTLQHPKLQHISLF